jgi:hypothetical protein
MSKFKLKRTHQSEIKDLIFPCHLGIILFDNYPNLNLKNLEYYLEMAFNSFFYDIIYIQSSLNVKEMYYPSKFCKDLIKFSDQIIEVQPTENYYRIFNQYKEEYYLDIVIGITNIPIFSSSNENLLYLFGEANRNYRSAVVSTFSFENNDSRIVKEIIHELGHLILGTDHCLNKDCVMSYAKTIIEVDNKSYKLCNKCENESMKLKVVKNV